MMCQERTGDQAVTADEQRTARQIGQPLAQGRPFRDVQPHWERFIADVHGADGAVDLNALVQWVLQDAYRNATTELQA